MSKFSKGSGLLLSALAFASAVAPSVAVADVDALPENRGFNVGGVANVSPFLTLNFLYDTNPNNAREGKKKVWKEAWDRRLVEEGTERDPFQDSWGYTVTPGIDITVPGNCWALIGRVKYTADRYDYEDVDDRDDWSESLTLSGQTESDRPLSWSISEMVRQSMYDEDYEYSNDDRLEWQLGAGLSKKISEKTSIGVNGSYSFEDFDDDTLHDHKRYGGRAHFARKLTDKTSWTLTATHDITKQDDFELIRYGTHVREYTREERGDKKAQSTRFLIGLTTHSDEKLSFDIRVGIENYKGFEDAEGERDTEQTITYELGAAWKYNERLSFGLSGHGQYEPSEDVDSNSCDTKSVDLSANYRIGDNLFLRAGIGYAYEDYEHKIVEVTEWRDARDYKTSDLDGDNRDDHKLRCSLGATYAFCDYASVFANLSYTDVMSSIDYFDYDRLRLALGLALRY